MNTRRRLALAFGIAVLGLSAWTVFDAWKLQVAERRSGPISRLANPRR